MDGQRGDYRALRKQAPGTRHQAIGRRRIEAQELQAAEPFAPGEKRPLAIRAEVIDAAYVVAGEPPAVDARLVEIDPSAACRGPRGYLLTHLPRAVAPDGRLTVKLWNGDPARDERRLTDAAEAALAPAPPDPKEADELGPLHR